MSRGLGDVYKRQIEYKSPSDSLSVDDFYKVYGYTNFYKADTGKVNEIPIQELTITLVSKRYPRELIRHLKEVRHYTIDNPEEGIYYVIGDILPIQIIVTKELTEAENLWLKSLTNELEQNETAEKLLEEYSKNQANALYRSVMELIVRANKQKFEEVKGMCDALRELMKDEIDAEVKRQVQERIDAEVNKKVQEKIDAEVDAQVKEKINAEVESAVEITKKRKHQSNRKTHQRSDYCTVQV